MLLILTPNEPFRSRFFLTGAWRLKLSRPSRDMVITPELKVETINILLENFQK